MSALSDYLEAALINAVLRGVAYTSPSATYVSLHTSDPGDAPAATELGGGATAYARVAIPTSGWTAPSDGSCSTTADTTFATAGSNWGTITHVAIWDAASGGNMLFHGALAASRTINNGDVFRMTAGNLTARLQ